jgi:hypothetical protein
MPEPTDRWLLLIHQIPPKPDYFRVKVRRRLHRLGAVPLKNSVYVLPRRESTAEDLHWLLREIVSDGGDGTLCEASFIEGVTSEQLEQMFRTARDEDYNALARETESLVASIGARRKDVPDARRAELTSELSRLKRRLEEIAAIDYFDATARSDAVAAITVLEERLRAKPAAGASEQRNASPDASHGRTWATRANVHVDRLASAWLIRRFIDPDARFVFLRKGDRVPADAVTFDMYDAEYTHEGDRCTFETLLARFELKDKGLRAIGEIVHDIDLKDGAFGREETPGVTALIDGIASSIDDDGERVERAAGLFDALHSQLGRRR